MRCVEKFESIYHMEPEDIVFCPYRVCPLGAHSDHQLGKVTGLALDKGTYIACKPKYKGVVELVSLQFPKRAQWHVRAVPEEKENDWADYLRGATQVLQQKYPLRVGISGVIEGSLPIGGLSSSAAAASADGLIEAFNLADKANSPIRSLSHGMRKRVMVAQAFLGSPELVMLDEPLSGLDPVEADRLRSFILERRGKMTIVISSHQLDDVEKLCSHVAFVSGGKVERMETMRSLTSDTGRIVYALRRTPAGLADIEHTCPGVRLSPAPAGIEATFFDPLGVEEVNAALLPRLLEFGVVSVTPGRSLEEAYLARSPSA